MADSDVTYCSEIEKENIKKYNNLSKIRTSKRIEQKKLKKSYHKLKYVAPKKKRKRLVKATNVQNISVKRKLGNWRDIVFKYVAGKKDISLHEAETIVRSLNKMHKNKFDSEILQVWEKLNVQMNDIVCEKKLCNLSSINVASHNALPEHKILSTSQRVPSKIQSISEIKAIDNIPDLLPVTFPEYQVQDEIVSQDSDLTEMDIFNSNIQKIIEVEHSYSNIKNTEPRKSYSQISDPTMSAYSTDLLDNLGTNNEKLISLSPVTIYTISDEEDNTNLISSMSSLSFVHNAQSQHQIKRSNIHDSTMILKPSDGRGEKITEKFSRNSNTMDYETQNAQTDGWIDTSQIHDSTKTIKTKSENKNISLDKENIFKPIVISPKFQNSCHNQCISEIQDNNYLKTFNKNPRKIPISNGNNTNLYKSLMNPEVENLPSEDCVDSSQIIDSEYILEKNLTTPINVLEKLQNSHNLVQSTLKTFRIQKNQHPFYDPTANNPQLILNEKQQKSQESEELNPSNQNEESLVQSYIYITQPTNKDFLVNSQSEHLISPSHVDNAAKTLNIINCNESRTFGENTALNPNCKNMILHSTETENIIDDSQNYVIEKHFPRVLKAHVAVEYVPARNDPENVNMPGQDLNFIKPRTELVKIISENRNTTPEIEMITDCGSLFLSENYNTEPSLDRNFVDKSFDWLKNISKIRKIHSDQCISKEHYPPEFWNNPHAEIPKEWENDFESW